MSTESFLREEASIVGIGAFNPKIFHPEWLIRKNIVPDWSYGDLKVLPDVSEFVIPESKLLQVLLNRFTIRTNTPSEYIEMGDIVANIFNFLNETPIKQLGFNYAKSYRIKPELWKTFPLKFCPRQSWNNIAGYIKNDEEKLNSSGLWDLTYQLPRPDELDGYIRPRIRVLNIQNNILEVSVNCHVELVDDSEVSVVSVIGEKWESSLKLSDEIIQNIIEMGGL